MKKWLVCLLFILAACNSSNSVDTPKTIYEPIDNKPFDEMTDRQFHITLQSAKEVYEVGEKIDVKATLTNISNENIQIGHGESWGIMSVTNLTEDYQFGFSVTEPYIMQIVEQGGKDEEAYRFSGIGYDDNSSGKPYSTEVYEQMKELTFPKGQYEIKLFVNFSDSTNDEHYEHELSVVFTVQ